MHSAWGSHFESVVDTTPCRIFKVDSGSKKPLHLVMKPPSITSSGVGSPVSVVEPECSHKLGKVTTERKFSSSLPKRFGRNPKHKKAWDAPERVAHAFFFLGF